MNPAAEVDYDVLAGRDGGAKLYSRLTWLAASASEHDGPPTQGMLEVAASIDKQINQLGSELERMFAEELTKLNQQAAKLGIPFIYEHR